VYVGLPVSHVAKATEARQDPHPGSSPQWR